MGDTCEGHGAALHPFFTLGLHGGTRFGYHPLLMRVEGVGELVEPVSWSIQFSQVILRRRVTLSWVVLFWVPDFLLQFQGKLSYPYYLVPLL